MQAATHLRLCREQFEVEERRHALRGGRALRVPAGRAMWSPACARSQCGPDGVPWIMVAFSMPDNTCEYRLIQLSTGMVHTVLTLGREHDPIWTDDEEESKADADVPQDGDPDQGSAESRLGSQAVQGGDAAASDTDPEAETEAEADQGVQLDGPEVPGPQSDEPEGKDDSDHSHVSGQPLCHQQHVALISQPAASPGASCQSQGLSQPSDHEQRLARMSQPQANPGASCHSQGLLQPSGLQPSRHQQMSASALQSDASPDAPCHSQGLPHPSGHQQDAGCASQLEASPNASDHPQSLSQPAGHPQLSTNAPQPETMAALQPPQVQLSRPPNDHTSPPGCDLPQTNPNALDRPSDIASAADAVGNMKHKHTSFDDVHGADSSATPARGQQTPESASSDEQSDDSADDRSLDDIDEWLLRVFTAPRYYQLHPWQVSPNDPQPPDSCPPQLCPIQRSTQTLDDPGASFWRYPSPNLGVDDVVTEFQFVAGDKLVFLAGEPEDNPWKLCCWQLVSIPDGRVTSVIWKRRHDWYHLLVAGKYIIAESKCHTLVIYFMDTLDLCSRIKLCEVVRQVADADFGPQAHTSREWEDNGSSLAVVVNAGLHEWVLVFDICTGALQASYAAPATYSVSTLQWIAPEPCSVLAIHQEKSHPRGSTVYISDRQVAALHVRTSEHTQLSRVYKMATGSLGKCIWPAPGGCLVLGLFWDQDTQLELHVMDVHTGNVVSRCLLLNDGQDDFLNRKPLTHAFLHQSSSSAAIVTIT